MPMQQPILGEIVKIPNGSKITEKNIQKFF